MMPSLIMRSMRLPNPAVAIWAGVMVARFINAAAQRVFVTNDFSFARLMIATTAPAMTADFLDSSLRDRFKNAREEKSLMVMFSWWERVMRVDNRPCWTTASWFSSSSKRLQRVSRQCCKVYTSWECLSSAATAGTVPGGRV